MGQSQLNDENSRILLQRRDALLRDVAGRERTLERLYEQKARALSSQLERGGAHTTKIREAVQSLNKELTPGVEGLIEDAVKQADRAASASSRALFGAEQAALKSETALSKLAKARIAGKTSIGKVKLSTRVRQANEAVARKLSQSLTETKRVTKTMQTIARRAEAARKITDARLASELDRLRQAARRIGTTPGQRNRYRELVESFAKKTRGGETIRVNAAASELLRDLPTTQSGQISDSVNRILGKQGAQRAKMISRSETVEAYRDSYVQSTKKQPFVKGYKWNLSSGHPKLDECDILAGQDIHGFGPGGYPKDQVPATPHPNDLCYQTAIMDAGHFKRELAKRKGTAEPPKPWLSGKKESSADWLRKQSKTKREGILGKTRARMFDSKPSAVLGKNGVPRPVRKAQAKFKKPVRARAAQTTPQTQPVSDAPFESQDRVYNGPLKQNMSRVKAERAIHRTHVENAMGWDAKGRPVIRKAGVRDGINFSKAEMAGMRRSKIEVFTHNHTNKNFWVSPDDIKLAGRLQVGELRAVSASGKGSRLRVTNRKKWSQLNSRSKNYSSNKTFDFEQFDVKEADERIRKKAFEFAKSKNVKFADTFERKWEEGYIKHAKKELNALGDKYGFVIEEISIEPIP